MGSVETVAAAELAEEAISPTTRPHRPLQTLQIQTKVHHQVKNLIKGVRNIRTYLPKLTGRVLNIGAKVVNLLIAQIH